MRSSFVVIACLVVKHSSTQVISRRTFGLIYLTLMGLYCGSRENADFTSQHSAKRFVDCVVSDVSGIAVIWAEVPSPAASLWHFCDRCGPCFGWSAYVSSAVILFVRSWTDIHGASRDPPSHGLTSLSYVLRVSLNSSLNLLEIFVSSEATELFTDCSGIVTNEILVTGTTTAKKADNQVYLEL